MSNIDIIRAWKDEEYRNSLTEEQRSQLPENPAGMAELSDEDMEALAGGYYLGGGQLTLACGTGQAFPTSPQRTCKFAKPTYPSFPSIGSIFPFRY